MIAAIKIRGSIGARRDVIDTLKSLNLKGVNSCVLLEDNPVNRGMLAKAKDFITYGEVPDETADKLRSIMRGKTAFLHPPRGGFVSIKRSFASKKGDLGNRKDAMDSLIRRMLP